MLIVFLLWLGFCVVFGLLVSSTWLVEKAECFMPVKRLTGKIVSEMTYNVSSMKLILMQLIPSGVTICLLPLLHDPLTASNLCICEQLSLMWNVSLKTWPLHWKANDLNLLHLIRSSASLTRALLKKRQSQRGKQLHTITSNKRWSYFHSSLHHISLIPSLPLCHPHCEQSSHWRRSGTAWKQNYIRFQLYLTVLLHYQHVFL